MTRRSGRNSAKLHPLYLLLAMALVGCLGGEEGGIGEEGGELGVNRAALTQKAVAQIDPASVGFQGDVTPMMMESPQFQTHLAYLARRNQLGASATSGVAAAAVTSLDTLTSYAAACEGATGIHVPPFNCNNGYEIPQGVNQVGLTKVNIGITGGTLTENVTVQTVTAGGADIWGTSDQFFFAHKSLVADGSVDVKVNSLTNTHAFAKAGIMARVSTAANAANVMIAITPTSGAMFQHRLTAGAITTNTILAGRATPTWLRLVRAGNTFSGFVSPDRVTWTKVGSSVTINGFGESAMVGLAVTSHTTSATATAVFDKFAYTRVGIGSCDAPNSLLGTCDPGSRFQVLAETPEAVVVANCRKQGASGNIYGDVAVLQLNQFNGAICFYQAYGVDGSNMSAPISGNTPPWLDPGATHAGGCSGCHDNGGFIRSPYLRQTGLLPSTYVNDTTPLKYVGSDWAQDKSWTISTTKHASDGGLNCTTCHRQGVSNFLPEGRDLSEIGTASRFAEEATRESLFYKTPHGPTAPIWMRPDQITYDAGAHLTALKFQACAWGFWGYNPSTGEEGLSSGFTNGLSVSGCTFTALGTAWRTPLTLPTSNTAKIGITVGTRTTNGTVHTLTAAGADIFGTSDQFLYAYGGPIGSGTAIVKVTGLTNTHAFAKAGLMWRDGVATGAMNAMITMTPTSGASFQYRQSTGGTTTSHTVAGHNIPKWLRLAKTGNTFVGSVSTNLDTWTQIGPPVTIANFNPAVQSLVGLAVTSHVVNVQATGTFDHFAWLPPSPVTLVDANIDITGGSRTFRNGTHTITAAGADIDGTSDQFFFAFKGHSSDGTISARVASIGNTDPYAKAGVMFRNGSAANAPNVMMELTRSQGAIFQYRTTAGGTTNVTIVGGHAAPKYVRLVRAGNTFTGSVSSNGSSWTQIGSPVTLTGFGSTTLAGLAVTSHNTGAATTATFTNVALP